MVRNASLATREARYLLRCIILTLHPDCYR
jgi:hypothetical protein